MVNLLVELTSCQRAGGATRTPVRPAYAFVRLRLTWADGCPHHGALLLLRARRGAALRQRRTPAAHLVPVAEPAAVPARIADRHPPLRAEPATGGADRGGQGAA